jgi:hypothetical protein
MEHADGWMDGWMGGWTDGWTKERTVNLSGEDLAVVRDDRGNSSMKFLVGRAGPGRTGEVE